MEKELLNKAIELRHELHRYPELSNQETETKKRLIDFLKNNTGLQTCDCGKWFYAVYKSPDAQLPPIGFRTDMDAIKVYEDDTLAYASVNKGVAHKCGHDGHCSVLCALACEAERVGFCRDIYFIFQHAEEEGNGAMECCEVIDQLDVKEIFGLHNYPGAPFGSINTRPGTINLASVGIEYAFTGTPTHASTPELGKNPAKLISTLVLAIDGVRNALSPAGILMATVIQIEAGERAFGVSASEGKLLLTVRGEYESEMNAFIENLNQLAMHLGKQEGIEVNISYHDRFPETYNHSESVVKAKEVCEELAVPYIEMPDPIRTSEDFGYFLKNHKGALLWIGAGEDWPPLHDKSFDYNDNLIEKSFEILSALARK